MVEFLFSAQTVIGRSRSLSKALKLVKFKLLMVALQKLLRFSMEMHIYSIEHRFKHMYEQLTKLNEKNIIAQLKLFGGS